MSVIETEFVGTNNNIAIIWFCNKPVNIFTYQLFKECAQKLQELNANPACKGVIILSKYGAKRNVFSAGFDLALFAKNDRDLSRKYLYAMTDMVKQIHEMGKPIIMGINGKNVAGGAVFAMTADYRIMKQGATLHYIEAAVNIAIVRFIFECVSRVVGSDIASYVFQTAIPLKSQKCLDLGLVNELVDDEQQLIKRAIHVLENEYFNANIKAAAAARYLGREYYIDYINDSNRGKRDIEALCDTFHSDRVQKYIKQFLKARKSKL